MSYIIPYKKIDETHAAYAQNIHNSIDHFRLWAGKTETDTPIRLWEYIKVYRNAVESTGKNKREWTVLPVDQLSNSPHAGQLQKDPNNLFVHWIEFFEKNENIIIALDQAERISIEMDLQNECKMNKLIKHKQHLINIMKQ